MLRIGLALVGAVAVLTVCAVSSSSALAAGQWYINGSKFTDEEAVEETWGLADLEWAIAGVKSRARREARLEKSWKATRMRRARSSSLDAKSLIIGQNNLRTPLDVH